MDGLREVELQLRRRGFASRADAIAAGVPDSTFTDAVARLDLVQTYAGLWSPSESSLELHAAARAALHVVGQPALLTAGSGRSLLGLEEVAAGDAEVVVPLHRSPARRDGICVHHTSTYPLIRYQHIDEMAVARAERCFADLAAHETYRGLATLIAYADRRRLITLRSLEKEVEKRKRFAGRTLMRKVLADLREEVAHSSYERLGRRLLAAQGHTPHRRPLTQDSGGRSTDSSGSSSMNARSGSCQRWRGSGLRGGAGLPAARAGLPAAA